MGLPESKWVTPSHAGGLLHAPMLARLGATEARATITSVLNAGSRHLRALPQ